MRIQHHLRTLVLVIPLSFLFGSAWGVWKWRQAHLDLGAPKHTLKMLTLPGFFPHELGEFVKRRLRLRIEITEVGNELELLNEMYANGAVYDLVQVSSHHLRYLVQTERLAPLDHSQVPNLKSISVDFRGLAFDPRNTWSVPIQWGINGLVLKGRQFEKLPNRLKEIWENPRYQGRVAFLSTPVEILLALERQGLAVRDWIRSGHASTLQNAVKELNRKVVWLKDDPASVLAHDEVWGTQMPSGRAAALLQADPDLRFVLPEEKSTLWVDSLALARGSSKEKMAHRLIDFLATSEGSLAWVKASRQAGVASGLDEAALADMQKPSYIRKVDLGRIELITDHEAFQPTWFRTLFQALPDLIAPRAERTGR